MGRSLIFVFLVACGNVQETPVDASPDVAAAGFTITATTPSPSVPIDGMNVIALSITRTGAFTGAVTVAPMSPPSGLTVSTLMIPAADSSGGVIVSAATPLAIGGTVSITLQATGEGVDSQMVTITDVPITGRPGSLDTSWGPATGLTTVSLGGDDDGGFNEMRVINGAVLAVGSSTGGLGAKRFMSERFTADGMIDATWNAGAVLKTGFVSSSSESSAAFGVGLQNDGRPVLIGNQSASGGNVALVRYSTIGGDGGVDFGTTTGARSIVNLGGAEVISDGLVLASNQIIAVGSKDAQMVIARMTSTGNLDTTFNSPMGFTTSVIGTSSSVSRVVVDSQDRLLVAGSYNAGMDSDVFIRRYTSAGALDGAFGGNNGVLITGTDSETGIAIATAGDKIIVASNAGTALGGRIRVRRYAAADGALDMTFGTDGVAEYTPMAAGILAKDMVVLPDGRIAVLADASGTALVIRFTANGAIDTLFGTAGDGTATVNIGDNGLPSCLTVYSPHLILVGGGNQGGTPGPGTFAIIARMWM